MWYNWIKYRNVKCNIMESYTIGQRIENIENRYKGKENF